MQLIDRIDLALKQAGKSRSELAEGIGLSTQAISNLKRRPGSTLRPENVAKAAKFMACDLFWLCTGEVCTGDLTGSRPTEEYQPERASGPAWGFLALEVASWLDALPIDQQHRAFAMIYQLVKENHSAHPLRSSAEHGHEARHR